ncbi:MAG: hypothetical protein FD146_99 [Anaerolineaceae bacterium]|nr:MAG: hypothetical protein FD146_99 [Anaerolineaceae bacterium]
MSRILPTLHRWASWKLVAILAALYLAFNFFILPAMSVPGEPPLPILDLKFWYTPQEAYQAISLYSPQARQASVVMHLTIDVVYPLVYGLLLSLLLVLVFRHAAPQHSQLPLLPWRAVIADYLENLGLAAMFLLYPSQFSLLSWATAIFTALKWIQVGFSVLALFAGILLLVLGRLKRRV